MNGDNLFGMSPWITGALAFVLWVVVLWFVKVLLLRTLRGVARRRPTVLDDVVLTALDLPLILLIAGTGLMLLGRILPLSGEWSTFVSIAWRVIIILVILVFIDRLLRNLITHYAATVEALRNAQNIVKGFVRVLVLSAGIFIVLDNLGISLTPLLAGLGIGSLAVALALQDTLANFFAGVQLVSDKPIKVGEYIGLESGEQGFVTKVGWRSTQIRMIQNNVVVMPNSQLINSRITNYNLPVPEMSLRIPVGVDYRSNLEHVERVTVEVAREIQHTEEGAKPDFEPFIRYKDFGDFSIGFVVVLRITDFVAQYRITHQLIKRLHERYNQEGIIIPFPIRTLEISRQSPKAERTEGPSGALPDGPGGPGRGEEQEIS